jgi:hypothetical protein
VALAIAVLGLACSTTTAEQRRDLAIQTALDSARAACLILQSDRTIEREPGIDNYCQAVLNGCGK